MRQTKFLCGFSLAALLLAGCKIDRSNDVISHSFNHYSRIDMKGGAASLKVKHRVLASVNQVEIYYEQSGEKFCVSQQSLHFNPALDLSSMNIDLKNSILQKISKQNISNFFPENPAYFDVNEKNRFKILNKNSGNFYINIHDFYVNKNSISKFKKGEYSGYLSVEFFLCSELFGKNKNPAVIPIIYKISLK